MVLFANGSSLGQSNSFCFYCGRPVHSPVLKKHAVPPDDQRTRDHVLPASKGGKNTVWACLGCNQTKRDLTLDEFRVLQAFRAGLIPLPAYKFAAEERT